MSSLTTLFPRIVSCFSAFCSRYRLGVRQEGDSTIWLKSSAARVEMQFERGALRSVEIYSGSAGPFKLVHVVALRNNFLVPYYKVDPSLEESKLRVLELLQRDLEDYCGDLLGGDPSALLDRDKYDEYVRMFRLAWDKYLKRTWAVVVPDEIHKGDFRYVKQLWDAELKAARP